jgi:hypothetical protein
LAEPLKQNVVVQFTTERTDKWKETELKYKGFKGGMYSFSRVLHCFAKTSGMHIAGATRGDGNLTFLFSTSQERGFTATSYQQLVTAIKKMFAGSVVQIIKSANTSSYVAP